MGCADGVGAADAFFEGDVFGFRDEELGVVAFALKGCEDLVGEVAGVGVFEEGAVLGAFAGGVVAVGGVEEEEHKKRELVVSRFPFAKIRNYSIIISSISIPGNGSMRNPDHGRPVNPLKIPLKRYSFTY